MHVGTPLKIQEKYEVLFTECGVYIAVEKKVDTQYSSP